MRGTLVLVLLGLVSACGDAEQPSDTEQPWHIELRDHAGRATDVSEAIVVVLFEPDARPRRAPVGLALDYAMPHATLPALQAGYYELWVPGCRPLRVDRAPTAPLNLKLGYPVDVAWRAGAAVPTGRQVQVQATWRGAGDHPEALLRSAFPAAARAPGERSWNWTNFVGGILIVPPDLTCRFHVPWPGPYRIAWGIGRFQIEETRQSFSASGGGTSSPGDGLAFVVSETGPVPKIECPPR